MKIIFQKQGIGSGGVSNGFGREIIHMDKYLNYTLEQLLWDESFRTLILRPTPEEELAKDNWILSNPEKAGIFLEAEEIIRSIKTKNSALPDNERTGSVREILLKTSRKPARTLPLKMLLRVAASVLVAVGLFFAGKRILDTPTIQTADNQTIRKENRSGISQLIRLEDGSGVVLKPGSYITFPKHFEKQKREVQLTGEAFFEVSGNPDRPFFVYAGKSVTKVLGTSFNIRAFEADDDITVRVKTGKVAVYYEDKTDGKNSAKPNLLEPNEQLTLNKQDNSSRMDAVPAGKTESTIEMQSEIPVSGLFADIRKAYGVNIEFDQEKLKHCAVMANLADLHLLEKLDAICMAINATYTVSEGKVTITGPGC
ncbi:FecR family protein [Dyadobacter sp. CY312]|uniref:FecR family protein n=1 Tax=Dyadobacter sp. CY312 TaxID=2907303 RepID=UPI001F418A68|nr:FecR family protein [Dyadobacter sp. CY312]MCE7044485.1 FecR domain-containing protein [Dyadobacter sp. CY312]